MKRLRTILIFLLLGAILNVVMAWGIAVSVDIEKTSLIPICSKVVNIEVNRDHSWKYACDVRNILLQQRFGVRRYSTSDTHHASTEPLSVSDEGDPSSLPVWIRLDLLGVDSFGAYAEGFGWPVISITNEMKIIDRGVSRTASGDIFLLVPGSSGMELPFLRWPSGRPRVLPLQPMWPGFASNTVFYSALLWLLIPGPFVFRRHLRRKRGLCVKCAYDLKGAEHEVCPECGAEVSKASPS